MRQRSSAAFILFALFITSCKQPAKNEPFAEETPTKKSEVPAASTPAPVPKPTPTPAVAPAPEKPPAKPAPKVAQTLPKAPPPVFVPPPKITSRSVEILPPGSVAPTLSIVEDESPLANAPPRSPKLAFTGQMRSELPFREAISSLEQSLPGHAITSRVLFVKKAKNVAWLDRASVLWSTFFLQVTDGSLVLKDGYLTMRGSVDSQFKAESLHRLATTIMSGSQVKGIQNLLTVR